MILEITYIQQGLSNLNTYRHYLFIIIIYARMQSPYYVHQESVYIVKPQMKSTNYVLATIYIRSYERKYNLTILQVGESEKKRIGNISFSFLLSQACKLGTFVSVQTLKSNFQTSRLHLLKTILSSTEIQILNLNLLEVNLQYLKITSFLQIT